MYKKHDIMLVNNVIKIIQSPSTFDNDTHVDIKLLQFLSIRLIWCDIRKCGTIVRKEEHTETHNNIFRVRIGNGVNSRSSMIFHLRWYFARWQSSQLVLFFYSHLTDFVVFIFWPFLSTVDTDVAAPLLLMLSFVVVVVAILVQHSLVIAENDNQRSK